MFVEWVDSCGRREVWECVETLTQEYREDGPPHIKSIGYLIDQTKHYILLGADIQVEVPSGNVGRAGRSMLIPRGCIIRMRFVKEPW